VRPIGLDMVEVASSNLAGPTKFLSLCFSWNLFFVFAESPRVVASYLYLRKVVTKDWLSLPKLVRGVLARYRWLRR